MDLIDRQAAIERLKHSKPEIGEDSSKERYRYLQWLADYIAIKEVQSAQTEDTDPQKMIAQCVTAFSAGYDRGKEDAQPEIIRCKDCKYSDENWRRVAVRWLPCMEMKTGSKWFCGSAERRTDG